MAAFANTEASPDTFSCDPLSSVFVFVVFRYYGARPLGSILEKLTTVREEKKH